eukprot:c14100_g1_i1.p1 GENE.c14100_g1_i1~~c14100_g1_i1.p1  ORF type:complete len:204 (-),score=26.16 c14100_g1_i1:144-755(-)
MKTLFSSGDDIILHVYDLSPWNDRLYNTGLGFYHSGLVVYGQEFTFGGGDTDGSGVFGHTPKDLPNPIREVIKLGKTRLSRNEVLKVIEDLSKAFPARSYNLVRRNCNHFCDELAFILCSKRIPAHINRMAYWGQYISCCFPSQSTGEAPVRESSMKSLPPPQFSGSGLKLSTADQNTTHTDSTEKRRRMVEALERRSRMQEE